VSYRRLLRRGALDAAEVPLFKAIVDALERVEGDGDVFSVLLYHRIGYPQCRSDLDPSLISATPEAFEAQIAYLASRRKVLSLDDLLDVRRGRTRLPPRSVAVTFDDGYRDFAAYAWPTLRRYDVPAILFVPTDYPDRPEHAFWWDRLHAAIFASSHRSLRLPATTLPLRDDSERLEAFRTLRREVQQLEQRRGMSLVDAVEAALDAPPPHGCVLGWDELRRLAREGLAIAPHTRTHALLDRLEPRAAEDEILGSARDLERELGEAAPAFAYPYGSHSDAVVACVSRAGFELAFTTRRGRNDLRHDDWLRLRRVNIGVRTPLAAVRAQLLSRPRRRAPLWSDPR
jgi:peptidoglycan/xylan/chitin deacetylase (PgdA/CDA1 family)